MLLEHSKNKENKKRRMEGTIGNGHNRTCKSLVSVKTWETEKQMIQGKLKKWEWKNKIKQKWKSNRRDHISHKGKQKQKNKM